VREELYNRVVSNIQEIEVPHINYDELIESKRALARSQDIEDIEQLKIRRDNPE
jgi:hypothetical protein